MEMELDVIERMGFNAYFLIVWDFVRFAKEKRDRGRTGPRLGGPARSSPTAWRSRTVDPLRYDLLFERFLNPERACRCQTSTSTSPFAAASGSCAT